MAAFCWHIKMAGNDIRTNKRKILVGIDGSDNSDQAFQCKYSSSNASKNAVAFLLF